MAGPTHTRRTQARDPGSGPAGPAPSAPSASAPAVDNSVQQRMLEARPVAAAEPPGILETLLSAEQETASRQLRAAAGNVDDLATRVELAGAVYKPPGRVRQLFGARPLQHDKAVGTLNTLRRKLDGDARLVEAGVAVHQVVPGAEADLDASAQEIRPQVEERFHVRLRRIAGHVGSGAEPLRAPMAAPAAPEEAEVEAPAEGPADAEGPAEAEGPAVEFDEARPKDPRLLGQGAQVVGNVETDVGLARKQYNLARLDHSVQHQAWSAAHEAWSERRARRSLFTAMFGKKDPEPREPPAPPEYEHDRVKAELVDLRGSLAEAAEEVVTQQDRDEINATFRSAAAATGATRGRIAGKAEPTHETRVGLVHTAIAQGQHAMLEEAKAQGLMMFSNFEIGRRVGSGGSDTNIYSATFMGMGDFAAKVGINNDDVEDEESTEALLGREGGIAESLDNKPDLFGGYGVIDRTDRGEKKGRAMIMDRALADLGTVFDAIRSDLELSDDDRVDLYAYLMKGGFEGLSAMHAQDLVHKDIKGGNLFLTEALGGALADFGETRSVDDPKLQDKKGTVTHMAPEVADSRLGYSVGKESDLWSMGETVLEALFGEDRQSGWVATEKESTQGIEMHKAKWFSDNAWQDKLSAKIDAQYGHLDPDRKAQLLELLCGEEEKKKEDDSVKAPETAGPAPSGPAPEAAGPAPSGPAPGEAPRATHTRGLMTFDPAARMDVGGALQSEWIKSVNPAACEELLAGVLERRGLL